MRPLPRGLYAILDPDQCGGRDPLSYAKDLLGAGIRLLQLRDKRYRAQRALELARGLEPLCRRSKAMLVINDRLDVTLLSGVGAIHLGPDDLLVEAARRSLGEEAIIGRSTNSLEEALQAEAAGADYLAFGPLYETSSKTSSQLRGRRGLEDLKALCARVKVPVYGIGGITPQTVGEVAAAGAAGVAVIGALAGAADLGATVAALGAPWAGKN